MSIFSRSKKGGFADVIRCDEPDYLIWKWHPSKYDEGELKRDTAIRTNSILKVKNGEVAVFVYNKDEDYILGPYDETIKTKNFPILSSIIGLWYEGDTPFQAEVFFINLSHTVQIKFGIPYFNVTDPRFRDFEVPVSVRGAITFGIEDFRGFVKMHRLTSISLYVLKKKVIDVVTRYIKDAVTSASTEYNIPVIDIESKIGAINDKAEIALKQKLNELFFIDAKSIDISAIEIDKNSDSYKELKHITKEMATKQAEANIKNYEEELRIRREEDLYAMHMETMQKNLQAYQTQVKGEVGVASANALGKMGENGAGNVELGSNEGFNPMTMMTGMALGSAVGQNLGKTLSQAINPESQNSGSVPPSIPTVKYYVAKDGNPTGPYDIQVLKTMIIEGSLIRDTLLWKEGMEEWKKAGDISDISKLFPPKIPV